MSFPLDLLAQARHLATWEQRKPKQASLRRSVSTAYYALFHFISDESAKLFIGAANQEKSRRDLARRSIAHARIKEVCTEFQKKTPRILLQPFWEQSGIIDDVNFSDLCGSFIDLQKARHAADYDFLGPVSRSSALDACDRASRAIKAWTNLRQKKPQALLLFAMTVLLWPGLSSR